MANSAFHARLFLLFISVVSSAAEFIPAYTEPTERRLRLLPPSGRPISIPFTQIYGPIAFSPDGKSIYSASRFGGNGSLSRFDLQTATTTSLPSGGEFLAVWSITIPPQSSRIFVTGLRGGKPKECGAFEIDPAAGTLRPLRTGAPPECGGVHGPVSPTGKQVLSYANKQLEIVDLESGAITRIRGVDAQLRLPLGGWDHQCYWSPDGRWIAAVRNNRITLIDASAGSTRRNLGSAGHGGISWSPDSTRLLILRTGVSCILTLYGASLESVSVSDGRHTEVRGSHCNVLVGFFGWVDSSLLPH